jgi:8-hydroxy-5-deazaflavin:NADPH oxidoreductase
MYYKTLASMNIAIIGKGMIVDSLAIRLAIPGHNIYLGVKESDTYHYKVASSFNNITKCSVEEAGAAADIIILAVSPQNIREASYFIGDVKDKVVLDFSSSFFPELGKYVHTYNTVKAITGCRHIVKCFCAITYDQLLLYPKGISNTKDMYIASESEKAKSIVRWLSSEMGFDICYDLGDKDAIKSIDKISMDWLTKHIGENILQQNIINT